MKKKLLTLTLFVSIALNLLAQNPYLNVDSLELALEETKSEAGCFAHKSTVRNAAIFFLNTPAEQKKSENPVLQLKRYKCLILVNQWIEQTPEAVLTLDDDMMKGILIRGSKGVDLMSAYIAAMVTYVIENHVDKLTKEGYLYTMDETLRYYVQNKKAIGKSRHMEELLALSEEERKQVLSDRYKDY